VSPVKYEIGFQNPEDDILHSHRCENLKSYTPTFYSKYQLARRLVGTRSFPEGFGLGRNLLSLHAMDLGSWIL
jgi:hypothetical protein